MKARNFKPAVGLIVAATLLSACTVGSHGDKVPEDRHYSKMVERTYDLPPINSIASEISSRLIISEAEEQSLTVITEDDHFQHLAIFVDDDGTLSVKHDGKHRGTRHTSLILKVKDLNNVSISGAVEADINDIDADEFNFAMSGMGDVQVSGTCRYARYAVSGMGNVEAGNFICQDVDASLSGMGNIEIYASESIDLRVSGIGNVDVYGGPRHVKRKVSGIGSTSVHD